MRSGRPLLVGIDVGTTLTKAGVVDTDGRELAHTAVPTVWQREPTGGYARPGDLFASVVTALVEVLAAVPAGEIAGVGVTSMAETVVLTDTSGSPVGPAIAWHDVRAAGDLEEMRSELGVGRIGAVTGLGTSQIPTIATLRWLMRNVPAMRRATSIASVAEWIAASLGGDRAAEASLASRTGALSVAEREWWPEVLEWAGIDQAAFPPVRNAGTSFGRVADAPPGAERLEGAVLTVAGHDHLCAAVGMGATRVEQVMDSCGTAEALVRAVPATVERDLAAGLPLAIEVGCHVLEQHYALIGGLSLGLNLIPILERLGVVSDHGLTVLDGPALALRDVADLGEIATGEVASLRMRTDAFADGVAGGTPARIWWSAIAAAVAGSRQLLDGLEELGGIVEEVRVSGGWSRNPVLMHLKAAAFPPLAYPVVSEAGIRGAALLAGLASGVYSDSSGFPAPELERLEERIPATPARATAGATRTPMAQEGPTA